MPQPRRPRIPRELFETRSHAWHSLGLGEELAPRFTKRQLGGLLLALVAAGLLGALVTAAAILVPGVRAIERDRYPRGHGRTVGVSPRTG